MRPQRNKSANSHRSFALTIYSCRGKKYRKICFCCWWMATSCNSMHYVVVNFWVALTSSVGLILNTRAYPNNRNAKTWIENSVQNWICLTKIKVPHSFASIPAWIFCWRKYLISFWVSKFELSTSNEHSEKNKTFSISYCDFDGLSHHISIATNERQDGEEKKTVNKKIIFLNTWMNNTSVRILGISDGTHTNSLVYSIARLCDGAAPSVQCPPV